MEKIFSQSNEDKIATLVLVLGLSLFVSFIASRMTLKFFDFSAEAQDAGVLFCLLGVTALFLMASLWQKNTITSKCNHKSVLFNCLWSLLIIILLISESVVTTLKGAENIYWFGYGKLIVIVSLCLIPVLSWIFKRKPSRFDIYLSITSYFIIFIYLTSVFQPPWGVIDHGHSMYVVNELLGPRFGSNPLINFSAQYTSLLGYFFCSIYGLNATVDNAIWFLTCLAVITVSCAIAPFFRAFPTDKKYLSFLFTIPAIFIVKSNDAIYSGSLSALFSAVPLRLIFPALIGLLLYSNFFNERKVIAFLTAGLLTSLAVLNNFESGVVSFISVLFIIFLVNKNLKNIYYFLLSFLTSGFIALLLLAIIYGSLDLNKLVTFVTGFGSGIGSYPMPDFGLWIFAFIFLSISSVVSTYFLSANNLDDFSGVKKLSIITLFWSLFGIGMSPYYINRSIVSGQLQFILFSVFLASVGLFLLISHFSEGKSKNYGLWIVSLLPISLSVASLINLPEFDPEFSRLNQKQYISEGINNVSLRIALTKIKSIDSQSKIALLSDFAPAIIKGYPVRSYLPFNTFDDLILFGNFNKQRQKEFCYQFVKNSIDYILVINEKPEISVLVSLCNFKVIYTETPNSGIPYTIFKKN